MSWILLLDIGNTNIKLSLARESGLTSVLKLPTDIRETSDSLGLKVYDYFRLENVLPGSIKAWVASSVVPLLDRPISNAAKRFCGCPCYFVPGDLDLPINNKYLRPMEVGADRLVTAFAARRLCQQKSIIVIDFGTATTFDCIVDHDYLGGLICPGLNSSIKALSTQTAKLPQFSLDFAHHELEIGQSTVQSLSQGTLFGFADLVEGLVKRLKQKLPPQVQVVGTGGAASGLAGLCPSMTRVQPDLLLEGLKFLSIDNNLITKEQTTL
ncbi:type III pantothenate kinase [Desulfonatronovibrio hydrogenovorans]|uniref:type III pantothenate kinase n=1 Tax=Desulfonatronovibrio hydrogenovorans TaxID=53245 RepID=UPI000490AAE3|nr:type III pantothenate kinase [Desulfonatronovibrio hydrogenovorans]